MKAYRLSEWWVQVFIAFLASHSTRSCSVAILFVSVWRIRSKLVFILSCLLWNRSTYSTFKKFFLMMLTLGLRSLKKNRFNVSILDTLNRLRIRAGITQHITVSSNVIKTTFKKAALFWVPTASQFL